MAYMSSFPLYRGQNHIHYLPFIDSDLLYTGTLSGRFDKNIVWLGTPYSIYCYTEHLFNIWYLIFENKLLL